MNKNIILFSLLLLILFAPTAFLQSKYGHNICNKYVEGYGLISYADWLHPWCAPLAGCFTKQIFDNVKKFIKPGSLVLDIGAHTGDTSVVYAIAVGPTGKVIAFEPSPDIFEILNINARLNNNIITVKKAITEVSGSFVFHYTDAGLCNGGFADMLAAGVSAIGKTECKIEGVNLIEYIDENCLDSINNLAFIKIDTEGYDQYILKSATELIKKYKPIVQTEVFGALNLEEKTSFWKLIKSLDYDCYIGNICDDLKNNLIKPLELSEFLLLPGPSIDILCFPKNNDLSDYK